MWKYLFTSVVIKIKVCHLCGTLIFHVALVPHLCLLCSICFTLMLLVSHCFARVAFMLFVLNSCPSCLALMLQIRLDLFPVHSVKKVSLQCYWLYNFLLLLKMFYFISTEELKQKIEIPWISLNIYFFAWA